METTNNGNPIGGGEILDYMQGRDKQVLFPWMDTSLMGQYSSLPWIKVLIIALLLLLLAILILKLLNIQNPFSKKGIELELGYAKAIKKRDEKILKATRRLKFITNIIQHSPFGIDDYQKDNLNYKLTRAGYKQPDGKKTLKAEEYNAIIKTGQFLGLLIGITLGIFISMPLGIIIVFLVVLMGSLIPNTLLYAKVKEKDDIILKNFSDFYLMIHYNLISGSNKTIVKTIRSYKNSTKNPVMQEFADDCIFEFETKGDLMGAIALSNKYKELAIVCKLMRLIKQSNEGADIVQELLGFREEIIDAKKEELQKKADKLIQIARTSFVIIYIILAQAILSAMAIYLDDLGGIGGFLG